MRALATAICLALAACATIPGSPPPPAQAGVAFDADGLVPAIAQDVETRDVLMMAWMNAE